MAATCSGGLCAFEGHGFGLRGTLRLWRVISTLVGWLGVYAWQPHVEVGLVLSDLLVCGVEG